MAVSYDVCVVGSGPGGGIAAYALAKSGLRVALLEAGPRLRAGVDYGQHAMPWEVTEDLITGAYARNTAWGYRERNHFTPVGDRPDHGWLKAVGGRSLCWAGHTLRFGPKDFREWPISYDEVAPYYSRAERLMGVYGNKDGLWNLPDGEYQKPIGMHCADYLLARGVGRMKDKGAKMELVQAAQSNGDRRVDRPRTVSLLWKMQRLLCGRQVYVGEYADSSRDADRQFDAADRSDDDARGNGRQWTPRRRRRI